MKNVFLKIVLFVLLPIFVIAFIIKEVREPINKVPVPVRVEQKKVEMSQLFFDLYLKEFVKLTQYNTEFYKHLHSNINVAEMYLDSMKLSKIKGDLYSKKYHEYRTKEYNAIFSRK